jgi:ATP-dependent Clp protease protease subunit
MIFEIEKPSTIFDKVYIESLKDRKIVLNQEIDASVVEYVCMAIRKFNDEDEANLLNAEDRKPIQLYINSAGGSVYDGFSAVNEIIVSKTPIHAICSGYCMSMAVVIYAAASKRVAMPYTNFMIHEISAGAMGRNIEIERVTKENKRLQKMYDEIITSRTKIEQKKLESVKKNSLDWFFGAEEALQLGLVTEIIK